jgi:hypothetical protein
MKTFNSGDRVSWRMAGHMGRGWVKRKLTDDIQIGSRIIRATEHAPRYLVKQEGGGLAFYRSDMLRRN